MVESKTVSWDVVDIAQSAAIRLCDEGILETVDWKKRVLDRAKVMAGDRYDSGVPSRVSATVIAYDKETSWGTVRRPPPTSSTCKNFPASADGLRTHTLISIGR